MEYLPTKNFMVNVGRYSTHGAYGICTSPKNLCVDLIFFCPSWWSQWDRAPAKITPATTFRSPKLDSWENSSRKSLFWGGRKIRVFFDKFPKVLNSRVMVCWFFGGSKPPINGVTTLVRTVFWGLPCTWVLFFGLCLFQRCVVAKDHHHVKSGMLLVSSWESQIQILDEVYSKVGPYKWLCK